MRNVIANARRTATAMLMKATSNVELARRIEGVQKRPFSIAGFIRLLTNQTTMISAKTVGMLVIAFVAGSFIASPELRAYAANTVRSIDIVDGEVKTADIGNGQVTAPKIKDGEVKAAEIATDAVGAAELQGVTKLVFAKCSVTISNSIPADSGIGGIACDAPGASQGNSAVATIDSGGNGCMTVTKAVPGHLGTADKVFYDLRNTCSNAQTPGTLTLGIIVFNK
jgi:hypothetical protein